MKTTLIMRNTANPRRTTLAHLTDADEFTPRQREGDEHEVVVLPAATANPERTILVEAPVAG